RMRAQAGRRSRSRRPEGMARRQDGPLQTAQAFRLLGRDAEIRLWQDCQEDDPRGTRKALPDTGRAREDAMTDKTTGSVLVTGGASGIGLETARLLSERGWRVFLIDLKQEALADACEELGLPAENGIACSITDEAEV